MNLATLMHGDLKEIADWLDSTEYELDQNDVKAILSNLCRRAAQVEQTASRTAHEASVRANGGIPD